MKSYYLRLKVVPTSTNEKYSDVEGAFANCWILEESPESAYRKAIFYINKDDWNIENIDLYPVETKRTDLINKEMGLASYDKAQKEGMAFIYVAWSRDGKTSYGPVRFNSSFKFDLEPYLKQIKKNQTNGRCLHYEAGERCNEFINAHSIQKKRLLREIQKDGQVYTLAYDIGSLKRNQGKLTYTKKSIKVVSTFLGFCQKHDNELFKPIDISPLIPTEQQVFLYAYRSLCRELFVKENALNTIKGQLQKGINQKVVKDLLIATESGFNFGLQNLKKHKSIYDDSLRNNQFEKIKYVLFISNQKPNIVFSSEIFPDFDFIGRQLQNLGDHNSELELITFCSTPLKSGWGFLFAWHESISKICEEYMKALATAIYEKKAVEDFLFRLAINCENHAIAPSWWENLTDENRNKIIEKTSETINIFSPTPTTYLMKGLEGISGWQFDKVISSFN